MKAYLSLVLGCLLFAGCATNSGSQLQISESRVRQIALVAELASFNGATIYLMDHPEKRPVFEKVQNGLAVLAQDDIQTLDKFRLIIKDLPIKELQSEKGQLIVDNAIILITAYNQDIIKLDQLEQAKKLKPLIDGINSGLTKALK